MKKGLFLFVIFSSFSISVNAQNLQRRVYNDGRVLVYIEQRNDNYRNNPNQRADKLQLENISGQEITVHYCYKAVGLDGNGNIFTDTMEYKTETLKPGEKKSESGYMSARGYYVDSFAIMNLSIRQSSSQSGTGTQQGQIQPSYGVTVPSWAQGTWGRSGGGTRITSTQFIQSNNGITLFCSRVLGNLVHFEGTVHNNNFTASLYVVVHRTDSPNRLKMEVYLNGETVPSVSEYSERWRDY